MTRPERDAGEDPRPPKNQAVQVVCSFVVAGEACSLPLKLQSTGNYYHVGGEPADGHPAQPAQAK